MEYPASAIFFLNLSDLADYGKAQAAGGIHYQYAETVRRICCGEDEATISHVCG